MASLTVDTTRYLDSYQVQDKYGNYYKQRHVVTYIDSNGVLTDTRVNKADLSQTQITTMSLSGVKFDDAGYAYYETDKLSRFLKYGISDNGTLNAVNYAGEKMAFSWYNGTPTFSEGTERYNNLFSAIQGTYNLDWGDVSVKGLSIARVIMIITLIRAEQIEAELVEQMDTLAKRTVLLNGSADVESYILDNMNNPISNNTSFTYTDASGFHTTTIKDYLVNVLQIDTGSDSFPPFNTTAWSTDQKNKIISAIQSRQDELNTISQEVSINIQSLINKRDQAYLLGTNSINLLLNGDVNVARNI